MRYADVIVPVPLDDSYTYIVPDEMVNDIVVGCRVQVGFGRSKTYVGIVVRLHDETPVGFDLKPILKLIDHTPVVNSRQLDFWRWISQYYICPLGDVYNAALPAKMKKTVGESKRKRKSDVSDGSDMQLSLTSSSLSTELSSAQQKAYDEICESFESKDITLLHGVTSSGKKSRTIIIYMNGMVAKADRKHKPAPGCQIVVPTKARRHGLGLTEWLSIGTSTASIATMIATIANLIK